MNARESIWRLIDWLMARVPSPQDDLAHPPPYPDPNEPGLSPAEREARLELLRHSLGKGGHGGYG